MINSTTNNLLKNFFSIADEAFYKENRPSSFFYETTKLENSIQVEMILPGYSRKELDVSSNGEELIVETNKDFKKSKWKSEFKRIFKLSDSLDNENIKATLENGILSIDIPKKKKAKNIKVDIK